MIDILLPVPMDTYDLSRAPGIENPGGGVGVKYGRVQEALSSQYTVRRVSHLEDVNADIVIVDPLWFVCGDIEERSAEFLCCGFERVLVCGSDANLLQWPERLRAQVVKQEATWRTHNSRYQQGFFRTCGIYDSHFLCDPVPEYIFYPAKKAVRVYACGQISWEKRTELLVELFTYLQGSHIETCYIGSASTWGDDDNPKGVSRRFRLQDALEDVTDIFLGNVTQAETAHYSNTSLHHMHVAEYDVSCQNMQEAGMGGAILWGLTHPICSERPVHQFTDIAQCAEAMLASATSVAPEADMQVYEYAMKHWSYEAFLKQFRRIVGGS